MADKGGNPNPQGKGKPTSNVGYPQNFKSPVLAMGSSKSWPTAPRDLLGIYDKRPANPLGIKHAGGAATKQKSRSD